LGEIFLKRVGKVPELGEACCKRPQLGKTLEDIAHHGPGVLYKGDLAKGLVEDVAKAGGIMTQRDLQRAEPRYLDVLEADFMGMKVLTFPPPSSGSVAVSILKQVEARNVPVATSGALGKHWLIEAMKNSFAVRMSLGDPGTKTKPYLDLATLGSIVEDLVSSDYAESLVLDTLDNTTRPQMEYGGIHRSTYFVPDDNGTSHLSVVDSEQNAVSMTTTINTGFGSKVVSESTGILLNNEMDDFSIPGAPNVYGLAPSETNFIQPGKKPLSSMSPSMVVDARGNLKMVVGASGGPRIITAVAQTILNYFDVGLDPLQTVQAPRLHHQLFPNYALAENYTLSEWMQNEGQIAFEGRFLEALRKFGHTLQVKNSGLGNCQMIVFECEEEVRDMDDACKIAVAVSDARKDGAPA
jgi:gamma-glutamyltranspeptidase/glutathione hydrolase/leukotriene-C4 hydrolase